MEKEKTNRSRQNIKSHYSTVAVEITYKVIFEVIQTFCDIIYHVISYQMKE